MTSQATGDLCLYQGVTGPAMQPRSARLWAGRQWVSAPRGLGSAAPSVGAAGEQPASTTHTSLAVVVTQPRPASSQSARSPVMSVRSGSTSTPSRSLNLSTPSCRPPTLRLWPVRELSA